jgi:large subunit ribosomal protein L10
VQKAEKERVVEELTERLKATESLIVADYRGLTNAELAGVRTKLRAHGATFTVVKNTLTRRAAEAAGTESLLALLEGPTAIAFVETDGDAVAVAKALSDTARETKILSLRGGILAGATIGPDDVEELAKLPPIDVLKSQLVGVIVAPLTQLVGLLTAPVRDLVGLIDARIGQLEEGGDTGAEQDAPAAEAEPAEPVEEPGGGGPPADEPAAEAAVEDEEHAADEPVAAAEVEETDAGPTETEEDQTQEEQE